MHRIYPLTAALQVPKTPSTCCDLDVLNDCGPVIMLAKTTDLAGRRTSLSRKPLAPARSAA